mmetsp:Transcript_30869/g.70170  ORF Transcript_30869/g.70170 Transcript_30869/m.70170 type:complete len:244 (+) Transcript_30869:4065-4796(+)
MVSFLKSLSLDCMPSTRVFSSPSSSRIRLPSPFEYRVFESPAFALRKVSARSIAVSAVSADASESLMACIASAGGRPSPALRNGVSASVVAVNASSAFSIFSCACESMRCADRPSRCLRMTARTSSSLSRACFARSATDSSSFLKDSPHVRDRLSASCAASAIPWLAGVISCSALLISSSDICPSAAAEVMMYAFSTSISALLSFPVISSIDFFAADLCSNSWRNFFRGFSFFPASVILFCSA